MRDCSALRRACRRCVPFAFRLPRADGVSTSQKSSRSCFGGRKYSDEWPHATLARWDTTQGQMSHLRRPLLLPSGLPFADLAWPA